MHVNGHEGTLSWINMVMKIHGYKRLWSWTSMVMNVHGHENSWLWTNMVMNVHGHKWTWSWKYMVINGHDHERTPMFTRVQCTCTWGEWFHAVFRIRIRPDPKLFDLNDPDPAPDPSLFHTKLKNIFLKTTKKWTNSSYTHTHSWSVSLHFLLSVPLLQLHHVSLLL